MILELTQADVDAATAAFYVALEKEDLTDVQRILVRGIIKKLVAHVHGERPNTCCKSKS